jgi:hypothetical protein
VVAYPARLANTLAVSATTEEDEFADLTTTACVCWNSKHGVEVDVCAPGDDIWSTWTDREGRPTYLYLSGTSMATPQVTGLAALILSYQPHLGVDELRDILITTTDDLGPVGWEDHYGHGRINAERALLSSAVWPSILDSLPPSGAIDAGRPTESDGSGAFGWQSVELTFAGEVDEFTMADFVVHQQGVAAVSPVVEKLMPLSVDSVRLTLDEPLRARTWTTIAYRDTGLVRLGYLPGDVNGNGTSTSDDMTALLRALNGSADPLPLWSIDLDRSGLAGPLDLLTGLDLLNGADAFDRFLGLSLP